MSMSTIKGPCAACGKPGKFNCSGCGEEVYCGKLCQKMAWQEHWYSCSGTTKTPSSFENLPLQERPRNISSHRQWQELINETKATYYPEGGSYWITICSPDESKQIEEYSSSELNRIIIFFHSKKREKLIKKMKAAVAGKEEAKNPGSVWHGAELAYKVTRGWRETFLPTFTAASHPRYRFDLLYGYTAAIYEAWFWMCRHPYNWDGHQMLIDLGEMWKAMLSQEAEQLGLDPVFSFPAVKVFLEKFKKDLEEESCDCDWRLSFNYE